MYLFARTLLLFSSASNTDGDDNFNGCVRSFCCAPLSHRKHFKINERWTVEHQKNINFYILFNLGLLPGWREDTTNVTDEISLAVSDLKFFFIFTRCAHWKCSRNNEFLIWSLFRFTFVWRKEGRQHHDDDIEEQWWVKVYSIYSIK